MKNIKNESLIILAGSVAYIISLVNDFHTDDWLVLTNYSDGLSWIEFLSMENLGRFRPLTNILLYFRFLAFGEHASFYYALNIALHVAFCILLYRFLLKIELPGKVSFLAALIFAVYFQHYEAVLWLYGTIRIFAAMAWIASLWALHEYLTGGRLKSLALFAVAFTLGLFVVEDFVIAPIGFALFTLLFTERSRRWSRLRPVALTSLCGLILYFVLRTTLIERPNIIEEYYYLGPHIISRLGAYFEWMALPPPDHSYFQRLSSRLSPTVYDIWDGISFGMMALLMAYCAMLIFKAPGQIRFFSFFIFLALLPALPLNYKVTSRNIYIPSIGLAVVLAYALDYLLGRFSSRAIIRRAVTVGIGAFVAISVASIWITSHEYRRNQTLVASMVADIQKSGLNMADYKFLLLDHMPGRTVIGPTLIYRLGYNDVVVASNDPVNGPIDIDEAVEDIRHFNVPFVVLDYRDGHLAECTAEYISTDEHNIRQ
jgi:hypothetical protein